MVFTEFLVPFGLYLAQLPDDVWTGIQFNAMALPVGKADGFHPVMVVECPGKAGCGILPATEKDKGMFLGRWDGWCCHVNGSISDNAQTIVSGWRGTGISGFFQFV